MVSSVVDRCFAFNNIVRIPDVIAIGGFYRDWLDGGGLSSQSVLACRDIPENANDVSADQFHMPRGAIVGSNLSEVHDVDVPDPEQVREFVDHSWDGYGDPGMGLHPWDGVTQAKSELGSNFAGMRKDIRQTGEGASQSWIRARRWRGNAKEVGPLARRIVGCASGREDITNLVTGLLRTMDLPVEALFSALGRTAARARERALLAAPEALGRKACREHLERRRTDGERGTPRPRRSWPGTWA